MAAKDNVQIARNAIAAVNAHDIEGYLQYIDDSYIGESETAPGPIHGRDGARQTMQTLFQAFPDLHYEIENLMTSGEHVIVQSHLTGTHKGAFAGIAATNKKASWRNCTVVELKNGKAIRTRVYSDNVTLFRQLGILAAPKATTAG
jgi:steroid delta-isomerase-like uncharacterized protein